MKRFLQTLGAATVMTLVPQLAGAAEFIIDIDDASHVKYETGAYYGAYQEVALQNGENVITQTSSEDFVLTPRPGFLIESITAYEADGSIRDPHGWTYHSNDDSYSIYFISTTPAAKYVVKTKVDDSPVYSLTITFDNAGCAKGNKFKIGNTEYPVQAGTQTVTYNPNKGKQFYMQLRPSVISATFTRNGVAREPEGTMADGTRTYKFNLEETENISVTTVMETPEFFLTIDDPSHVKVYFPDNSTQLTNLVAGENRLLYNDGDGLRIEAVNGYKVKEIVNMNYNSLSEYYFYYFKDGNSGMRFNVITEEFTPPTATVTLNLDNLGIVNHLGLESNTWDFVNGDNNYTFRTDKVPALSVNYKIAYYNKIIASCNGEELPVLNSMWDSQYSEVTTTEGEHYRIVVRELMDEYTGTATASTDDNKVWNVNFTNAGIIRAAGAEGARIVSTARTEYRPISTEIDENDVKYTFEDGIPAGDYTLEIPAGAYTINGAPSPAVSHAFTMQVVGIDGIAADNNNAPLIYTIDGRRISSADDLEPGLYIINGKKTIIKK